MNLVPRPEETIEGTAQSLREGSTTCVDLVRHCFAAVDEWESKVHAWVSLDHDGAIAHARVLDEELRSGRDRGPLHGIPFGIKDIIDVVGFETRLGSPRSDDWTKPTEDAAVVARLREAGAVILGKTVTTAFAWIDPPATRNPWNLDRTPGGSSSGSAVAVATRMCLGALGSQTGGSITRPASFCGVAGLKPTFGTVSTSGVYPFASSLDTIGPIAKTTRDLSLIYSEIRQEVDVKPTGSETAAWSGTPRIGRLRGMFDLNADDRIRLALDRAMREWSEAGAVCMDIDLPDAIERNRRSHRIVMASQAARVHQARFKTNRREYPPKLVEIIDEGAAVLAVDYIESSVDQSEASTTYRGLFDTQALQVLATPAAVGPAPDPSTTGDPIFNAIWTFCGLPTITFPIGRTADGLPLGVQLIGKHRAETELFAAVEWCERIMRPLQVDER